MKIVNIRTVDLVPFENNSRTHDLEQILKIVDSINEFGFTNPILIDSNNGIIAGHGRVLAATRLELEKVPCIVLPNLSPEQKRAYVIADNRLALDAGWDESILAYELKALMDLDYSVELTGFDFDEIDKLLENVLGEDDPTPVEETGEVDEPEYIVISKGDIIELEGHRLLCGDSSDIESIEKLTEGGNVNLVLASPAKDPGDISDAISQSRRWVETSIGLLGSGGVWFCWGSDSFVLSLYSDILSNKNKFPGLSVSGIVTWDDGLDATPPKGIVMATGDAVAQPESFIWRVPGKVGADTTEKPLEILSMAIESSSEMGGIVFDPFLGSGASLISADSSGRKLYGIESNPKRMQMAIQRWCDFTQTEDIKINGNDALWSEYKDK